jgi:hypothetical protein
VGPGQVVTPLETGLDAVLASAHNTVGVTATAHLCAH